MGRKVLLTRKQAADYAGVTVSAVDKWIESGALKPRAWTPGGRPRFHPDDLLCRKKPVAVKA